MTPTESDMLWCRALFRSLKEGGLWGVPRSGLVFFKEGGGLALREKEMAYGPYRTFSRKALRKWQRKDYLLIKEHFEAAGIPVKSEVEL